MPSPSLGLPTRPGKLSKDRDKDTLVTPPTSHGVRKQVFAQKALWATWGKVLRAPMTPAAFDSGQRRARPASCTVTTACPGEVTKPIDPALIPEAAHELGMHSCFRQEARSARLDSGPQLVSLPSHQAEELQEA